MRKKFLLMTFFTLLFTAMGTSVLRAQEGYVAKVGDTYFATLAEAIAASNPDGWGTEVTLLKDITLEGGYVDEDEGLRIENSVTINGAGHTIDCGTYNKGIRIYQNGDNASNVMFKNINIVNNNYQGRCIDTRSAKINLMLNGGVNLTAPGTNSQPLTIGGSEAMTKVTISGGTIDAGTSGYGVICFVPVTNHINVQGNAVIKGFAAFYLKEDVNNTSIKLSQSTSIGKNEHASASGVFGAVVIEGSNNTVRLEHDQAVVKAVAGDGAEMAPQAAFLFRGNDNTVGYYNATPQVITEGGQSYFLMAEANATGTKFVDKGIERKLVAENEGYQFYSLEEAVRFAGNEGTIKVVNDFELAETWTVAADQNITLDLNGKTINVAYAEGSTTNHIYAIDNSGTLKITGNGTINARGIFNYGAMTLENGTINAIDGNGGYAVRNYAGGSLTMNGGTIATTLEDDHQVNNGGYDATTVRVDEGATFTMNGGVINNICDFTVAIDNHGTTIITDGKATTVHTTLANHGTMTINGGEFTCNGIEGITAHALWAAAGETTINGGTFNGKDNYNGFNVDASQGANVVIKGGNFLSVHSGSLYGDGTITVSGGTFFDPVPEARCAAGYIPQDKGNGTYGVVVAKVAKIGDVYYETLAEAVAAAQDKDVIEIIKEGNYTLPEFAGKELTFKGSSRTGTSITDWVNQGSQGMMGSTVHFENLTISGKTENYYGLFHTNAVTYKNCNINGLRFLYSPTTFEDCAFNANGVEHSFWTYGASNVTVKNSTFTYTDRAVNCYSENGANHELDITFTGCTFTYAGTNATPEGAVEINSGSVKSIDLVMNGCTAPANGAMWFNSQWDLKHGANTVVEVDGVVVWTAPVKIGETKYATLQEAVDAAQDGDVVTLIADVTEDEVLITQKADVDVTIDGNGKTFTGHMTIFGSGRHTGAETLTIQNVVFQAVVDEGECIASATNINGVNSYAHNVTIDGCSFNGNDTYSADNTFAIRFPSGGVGYDLTVTGCTADEKMFGLLWVTQVVGELIVNDCTAEGVTEGIVLTSTAKATITNTTIDASNVAIRAGQAGAADGTINEFTFNNNTLKSDAIAIQIRGNATDANLSMTENVVSGTPHISGNTAATNIDADANYWGEGLTGPVVAEGSAPVVVNSYYTDEACEQLIVTALTLQQFVEKVTEGNGTYNGTFTEGGVEKNITVKVVPVSGDAGNTNDVRVPNRLQKYTNPEVYYAQYQRFSELTDVNISNVNFVFYPAAVTVTDAWNTAGATTTADNINGELQLMNTGIVSFANCSFEKMSVSPIYAATLSVTSSTFNGLDAYAIKDIKATTATITGTTFTDCNGGFWFNNAPTKLTVTDNTFTGTGRRGAIQFSANGDYANTEMTVTGNEVTDDAAFLWQLNNTISNAQLNAILDKNNNEYTTAFVEGSVELHLQGEGTADNPYLINDISDLEFFRDDVNAGNDYEGKYVALTADIDLNNEEWTPIGNDTNKFQGYFDGNEKTISNLKVTGNTRYKGFFGYIKGTEMSATTTPSVKDLTLDGVNVNVEGDGYFVGGLAGQAYTCNITNVTVKGNVSGKRYVGGLVGHVYTYFKDCHFIGNASCSFDALGGIAGAGDCRAYDCSVIGNITGSNWVGGIVGNGQEGTSAVGCYVKGVVKTSNNYYRGVGGIAGVAGHGYTSSEFKNNYFDGEVYLEDVIVPAMIMGIVNANNNASIKATVEGNSWNTDYYDVNTPVYVVAEISSSDASLEEWITGASEELTKPRNNNLIMLESDLPYVTEEDYVIMPFSEVTEEQVEQALINNAVAKIGETTYTTLQKALDAAVAGTGNVTVEIIKDIDLTNVDWNPVTVSAPGYPLVTIEGNDKTIKGLNDMLFAGTWAGNSGLIINDLTIKESNIVHDENDSAGNIGVGAFIGFPQASATITLNNCHLVNSTVKGGHWTGGLIGMAGGYNGNDGPVFMNLTIEGCSVTGSTITGKGSCGGIIGHGSCAAWTAVNIQTTIVSGNTVTSTGSSTNKAGAVMGTIGAAGQPTTANGVTMTGGAMVAATVSGNTVTSGETAITTIYGRQGTETGMLELNGGTYDNYPIEENVAYAKPAAGLMIEQNEYGTYGLVPDPAYGKVAMIGETYYETLSAAFAAVTDDEQTVVILSDVTEKLEANLRGNITTKDGTKVTITLTNQDWVYCPYTFILGENITLNVPALFYYAGGAQINGTVVAGAYYQSNQNTKLTINEPGSMKVTTETFIVRYMNGDPNAGIYIIGDNNDETIGLDASVIYFYQGMINAKNADIKVGTYWQTNETDNQGSANLVLDNSNMTVTVNEHNMKATANSTVTLTNGSNVTVAGGYQGVGVSIDATSSMTMARSIFVSKINNYHYTSLQEAATAAQDGETIELLWQEGQAPIAMNASLYGNKNVTITGTATVDWSKGFLFVGRGGEGNAKLTFESANLTSASNSASYGIHVSGREKGTNDKYDGTLVVNNSTIDLDYLINKGTMTLDNSTLTVKNGFSVGGRPGHETESGVDATATITLSNNSKVVVNDHNGMGLGYEAIGVMNINSGSTFETTEDFLITAKGTMNVNGGNMKTVGTLTNNGAVNVTGESILDIETLTGTEIYFLDGAIIKNSTVGGEVFVAGKVTFRGNNTFAMLYDFGTLTGYYGTTANMEWTVEEGASLTLTNEARYGLGYGDKVTVYGEIEDALTARENLTENDRSLFMHGLVAQESSGFNCNSKLTVNNAYVVLGSNNSFGNKSGNYGGNYTFNFKNSVVDGSRITFYEASSITEFTFEDSDVKIGTFMTRDTDSKFTLKNSKVLSTATNNGTDEGNYNAGELTLDKSSLTYSAAFTNVGTLNLDLSSKLTAPSVAGDGIINIDATNFDGNDTCVIKADMASFEGVINVEGAHYIKKNDGIYVTGAQGTLTKAYTSATGYWGECGGNANESFVLKFYNDNTYMGQTSLNDIDNIIDGDVYVTWSIDLNIDPNAEGYWDMSWDIRPTLAMQPNRVEQWIDGEKVAECAVEPNWADNIFPVVAAVTDENDVILSYVNNTTGATLNDAFAAGGNIAILRDFNLAESVTVPADKTVVLNLNGKTMSQTKACTASYEMINNKGNLTITGNGKLSFKDTSAGDPNFGWGSYTVRNEGNLVVENGTIEHLGEQNQPDNVVHMYCAIFQYSGSSTINDGTISTPTYRSARLWKGDMTINGGTFDGQVWVQAVDNTAKLTIKGGTFEPNGGDASAVFVTNSTYDVDFAVTGGTFETKIGCNNAENLTGGLISGGNFSATAAQNTSEDFLAEGFAFNDTPDANGYYTVIQVAGTQTREFAYPGWYWFSTYIDFESGEDGLDELQEQLGDNAATIKGQKAFTNYQYYNGVPFWTSALTSISASEMYMIKTTNECLNQDEQIYENVSVSLEGDFVDYENYEITIHKGWNWIGYPLNTEVSVRDALAEFTPAIGDQIKGKIQGTTSTYMSNNKWIPNFNMIPGEGYMYYSAASENKTLTYSAGNGGTQNAKTSVEDNHWIVDEYKYSNNMTVIAMLSIDGEIVKGNYEVAAFANGECRGSARPIYIESIDAYVLFMTIHGDEVEELTFMYYDIDKDTEYELNNVMNYSNDAIVGTIDNPYIFSMNILGIGENSIDNINIYPNPTTTDREINLQAICDKVEVFNALGVKVAEYHNVDTLDALETAGIYVIRITNDNAVKHCRLVVK